MRASMLLLVAVLLGAAPAGAVGGDALRLETVLPTLPGKNRVRWFEFDWKLTDFTPHAGGAPVRLYFYEDERPVAETAQPLIARAYREHVRTFDYVPTRRIPFLLYNSHFEFESTQAFFVSEGVLGITSTTDLTMALPYWGEHLRFEHVMRHELVHQFNIQQVSDLDRKAGNCGALQLLPLWFVEGTAETFSLPDLTPEVRAALADRLLAGRPGKEPRGLPAFFAEEPLTFERVYLLGHAQVRFLEQEYGEGTVRRLLAATPQLCLGTGGSFFAPGVLTFAGLVERVLGVERRALEGAWRRWAGAQARPSLEARQPFAALLPVEGMGKGELDSFSLSPDGRVLLSRLVDPDTGVARLYLQDVEDPSSRVRVTEDQRIGLVSLHPGGARVTAVGPDFFVYLGRVAASDVLFVRRYTREEEGGRVRLRLHGEVRHELSRFHRLLEGSFPAISPTGAVAFVGLPRGRGFLDVYRLEAPLRAGAPIVQVTDDAYAEQALAFGPDGALYYASDATPDAHLALFRWREGRAEPLVAFPGGVDATAPRAGAGALLFESGASGLVQAWRLAGGVPVRLTDAPTGFGSPAETADGRLLGVVLQDGHRRLVALPRATLLSEPAPAAHLPAPAPEQEREGLRAWSIPRTALTDVQDYQPLAPRNYSLVSAFGAATGGPFILGQVVFADRFKSHLVGLSAQVFGGLDLASGELVYLDQSRRLGVGGGLFARSSVQLEGDPFLNPNTFVLQRLGALLQLEYPFGPYVRVGGFLAPQVLRTALFSEPTSSLAQTVSGHFPALQAGAELAVDTLRLAAFGPYDGVAFSLRGDGTVALGRVEPFGTVSGELLAYKSVLSGFERLFLRTRLAAGATLGGPLRESFYLPPPQNLRAFPQAALLPVLGRYYALAQAELHFPLLPDWGSGVYLQGLVGADVGSIFNTPGAGLAGRQAAAVLGTNLLLGPLAVQLHFARPLDIGAGVRNDRWLTFFTIGTPFNLLQ